MWKNCYSVARDNFLSYSSKNYSHIVKKSGSYYVNDDKYTSIDYLFLGNPENTKLHILISGTHGVEGYAGSAIQFKTLDRIIENPKLKENSYLMIHALNPYGYKYNRRCTKDNVDLNRNYLESDDFHETNYPYSIFELVSTYLFSLYFVYLFFYNILHFGYTKSREYIVKGQYDYNNGLFYGGEKREENIEILEKILSTINYDNFNEVYVFDIHTGLGKYGNLSVMVSEQNTVKDLIHLPYNPTTKLINMGTDNMYRDSKGSIVDGIDEYLTKKYDNLHIYPIILEYGTYHNLRMFFGLLMENYYYCKKDKDQWSKSNQRLKSLFYIQDEEWQNLVIENYTDFITILM